MSPYSDEDTAGDLEQLILTFTHQFRELYQMAIVHPKLHFLCHLVQQILKFDPLSVASTLKFEAKHGFFKDCRWEILSVFHFQWQRNISSI